MSEVDRYIIYPGPGDGLHARQAGNRQARDEAQQAMGPRFDIKAFHDRVLEDGAVPVSFLHAKIRHGRRNDAPLVTRRASSRRQSPRPRPASAMSMRRVRRRRNRAAAFDVQEKTIAELQAALTAGTVTSRSLVLAYLGRIRAFDLQGPRLNAMIAMNPKVLEAADALDRERAARGPRGPLHGIPIVVKDNFETVDMPTTGGSLALTGFMTGRDAFQVKRLRDAGAVIIGKTNLHELAAGITTISSLGGQTRNPYDPARNPGGSSGGTGAAVAASFAAAGMGSDTCGSIRIPAGQQQPVRAARHDRPVEPRRHHPAVAHPGHRRSARAHGRRSRDHARRDGRRGPGGSRSPQRARGHIPPSYRDLLSAGRARGRAIGVLKQLFGAAPEDEEVDGDRSQGARGA